MKKVPCDPRLKLDGLMYFPRMLDKIRLHARGELREDFHANLGKGFDARLCRFLLVAYDELKARVLAGASDAEVAAWCAQKGGRGALNDDDRVIWNNFVAKRGWNDEATPLLEKYKADAGLAGRTDIVVMLDFMEVDEGRR